MGQAKFEKSIGVSNGFVNNIRSSIQPERLQKIAQLYPELNIAWLMVGDLGGKMLKESEQKPKPAAPAREEHSLPLIPFDAVAGPGDPVYEDERIEDYYTVSEFKDSDFLIRVKGDSMTPRYTGGDLLACKKIPITEVYFFQWNRCYVLLTRSQGAMVKRIQPSEKDGWIKCVSDNTKYAPFDVPMEDIVSVALVNGSISLE
jgi:hypothetical protein